MQSRDVSVNALLFGLNEELAGELSGSLRPFCSELNSVCGRADNLTIERLADSSVQVIFCNAETGTVSRIHRVRPDVPIIVVSREQETGKWLDSMEAGASDYCAAPFESFQLNWMLDRLVGSPFISV